MLFMNRVIKRRLMVHLGFTSWKHFVIENKFQVSHFTQMRNCRSRTLSALGGRAGRLLLLHWQPLSFHLWDETLQSLDLPQTDSLLIGDQGLDVLEEDIDLCPPQQQQLECRVQWCVKWSVLLSCCRILGFSARDLLCTLCPIQKAG